MKGRFVAILHKLASGDTLHVEKKIHNVKWTQFHIMKESSFLSIKENTCEGKHDIFNGALYVQMVNKYKRFVQYKGNKQQVKH